MIAIRDNKNLMKNDLTKLPWAKGQLQIVNNYLEAVGALTALKHGIAIESVLRPLAATTIDTREPKDDRRVPATFQRSLVQVP